MDHHSEESARFSAAFGAQDVSRSPLTLIPPPTVSEPAPSVDQTPACWFTEELQPHDASLKAYLRGAFPSLRDVDDVVQESYLRVWKARATDPILSAKAFLFRVARNLALDLVRRHRALPVDAMPDLESLYVIEEGKSVGENASTSEEIAFLAEAIATLPPRCREIIILRKLQGIPQKVVAARLGISELTVQEQVYRGMRRCEKILLKRGVIRTWHHE